MEKKKKKNFGKTFIDFGGVKISPNNSLIFITATKQSIFLLI